MSKLFLYCCLTLALLPGCASLKRSSKSKENTSIVSEVQETFRKRWVDKRTAELVAQGKDAPSARTQADEEFRKAYDFSKPGTQK